MNTHCINHSEFSTYPSHPFSLPLSPFLHHLIPPRPPPIRKPRSHHPSIRRGPSPLALARRPRPETLVLPRVELGAVVAGAAAHVVGVVALGTVAVVIEGVPAAGVGA